MKLQDYLDQQAKLFKNARLYGESISHTQGSYEFKYVNGIDEDLVELVFQEKWYDGDSETISIGIEKIWTEEAAREAAKIKIQEHAERERKKQEEQKRKAEEGEKIRKEEEYKTYLRLKEKFDKE